MFGHGLDEGGADVGGALVVVLGDLGVVVEEAFFED